MKVSQSFVVVSLSVAAQTQVSMASPVPDAADLSFDSPQFSEARLEEVTTPTRLVPKGFGRRAHPSLMSLNPRARAVSLSLNSNGRVNHRVPAQGDRSKLQNSIHIGDTNILNASLGAHRPIPPLANSDEHGLRANHLLDVSLKMKKRAFDEPEIPSGTLPDAPGVVEPLTGILGARALPSAVSSPPSASGLLSSLPMVSDLSKSLPASNSSTTPLNIPATGIPVLGSIFAARSEDPLQDHLTDSIPSNPFSQEALSASDIMAAGGAFPIQPSHSLDGQTLPNEPSIPNLAGLLAEAENIRSNDRATKKHHKSHATEKEEDEKDEDEDEKKAKHGKHHKEAADLEDLADETPLSSLKGAVPTDTILPSQLSPASKPATIFTDAPSTLPVESADLPKKVLDPVMPDESAALPTKVPVAGSATKPLMAGFLGERSLPAVPSLPIIGSLPSTGAITQTLPVKSVLSSAKPESLPLLGSIIAEIPILGSLLKARADTPLAKVEALNPSQASPSLALPITPSSLTTEPSIPNFSVLMSAAEHAQEASKARALKKDSKAEDAQQDPSTLMEKLSVTAAPIASASVSSPVEPTHPKLTHSTFTKTANPALHTTIDDSEAIELGLGPKLMRTRTIFNFPPRK
ncbi:hypothetical protein PCASD_19511 [Puccinia coronata f. sp. avenae]|uniref:Uncharacterized protein n=1 Tax=Puccinia coronata f. sp. avenae TaxID=200324 RepID=A0A2N5TPM9_9BASI|nr:hypothetical protein PCASD_19511 [Puccinia coronata f. sp. avenae]